MITGQHIAETAINSGLLGRPYSEMDCQAFVEKVLQLAGLKIINYKGSNHMWRELVDERTPVKGNTPPAGALAFIIKDDGGEKKRGYHDDMKNASHVAIVIDHQTVMESTTGGVQYGRLSRFTAFGLIKNVDYFEKGGADDAGERPTHYVKNQLVTILDELKNNINRLERIINDDL